MGWWTHQHPGQVQQTTAGLRIDFGLAAGEPVQAGIARFDAPEPIHFDFHEGLEVGIVLKGAQFRRWGAYETEIGPGDVWFCAAWEPHAMHVQVRGTEVAVVVFLPEFLGDTRMRGLPWLAVFAATPSARPRAITARTRALVLAEGESIKAESRDRLPLWREALRVHLVRTLWAVTEGWSVGAEDRRVPQFDVTDLQRIQPALRLVGPKGRQRVSLEDAAAVCRLSRARFSTLFRNTMGLSFGAFCQRARVALAAQMLVSTDLPLQTVADDCGFSSASHLHKAFFRHYQCTPGEYRSEYHPAEIPARSQA